MLVFFRKSTIAILIESKLYKYPSELKLSAPLNISDWWTYLDLIYGQVQWMRTQGCINIQKTHGHIWPMTSASILWPISLHTAVSRGISLLAAKRGHRHPMSPAIHGSYPVTGGEFSRWANRPFNLSTWRTVNKVHCKPSVATRTPSLLNIKPNILYYK